MQEVLLSSGFTSTVLEAVAKHWRIIAIDDPAEAIAYLHAAKQLPAAVVLGNVQRPGPDDQLHWDRPSDQPIMPAHASLAEVRKIDHELPVVISTSLDLPGAIVELVKRGAFDYVIEPKRPLKSNEDAAYAQALIFALGRAVLWRQTVIENRQLRKELQGPDPDVPLVGRSLGIKRVVELIRKVAPTPATVLVTGESGTGKELVARAIHSLSQRPQKPFVAINCGTFTDALISSELFGHVKGAFTGADSNHRGMIREADNGTLFLDEIGTVSPAFQVSLLRVLENRTARPVGGQVDYPVNCRFIAAANRNLLEMTRSGTFREDLYYRLNLFHIHLPALRERAEDIPLLAQAFLTRAAREYSRSITGFEPDAMDLLERFDWPGNVRQLRNAVERAVILCETGRIAASDLPENIRGSYVSPGSVQRSVGESTYRSSIDNYERELIESALRSAKGNISNAAKLLSIRRTTLHSRLIALGIRTQKADAD